MKLKFLLFICLLLTSKIVYTAFLFCCPSNNDSNTNANYMQKLTDSDKTIEALEKAAKEDLKNLNLAFKNKEISEDECKKIIYTMYFELILYLPQEKLDRLFPGLTRTYVPINTDQV